MEFKNCQYSFREGVNKNGNPYKILVLKFGTYEYNTGIFVNPQLDYIIKNETEKGK